MRKPHGFGIERVPPGGAPSPDPGSQAWIEARGERSREKPILFSLAMARAVWDGVKTVTRRPLRPQPPSKDALLARTGTDISIKSSTWMGRPNEFRICGPVGVARELANLPRDYWRAPYAPGDRLWLRHEFWRYMPQYMNPNNEQAWDEITRCVRFIGGQRIPDCVPIGVIPEARGTHWEKRPSIHMPRWASVIHREVVSVRAERLQDITESDAMAEGIRRAHPEKELLGEYRIGFKESWDALYAKRGLGWDTSPFVWRIEFKEISDAH